MVQHENRLQKRQKVLGIWVPRMFQIGIYVRTLRISVYKYVVNGSSWQGIWIDQRPDLSQAGNELWEDLWMPPADPEG